MLQVGIADNPILQHVPSVVAAVAKDVASAI
jgi:hypothetical protein